MFNAWGVTQLEQHCELLVGLLLKFLEYSVTLTVDMKVTLQILDRLSDCRALIVTIANGHQCMQLMASFHKFLSHVLELQDPLCVDGLIRFLKKVSSYEKSHEAILRYGVHQQAFGFLQRSGYATVIKSLASGL